MSKFAMWIVWALLISAVLLNTVRLYGQRDGYAQRAWQAEQNNADLLDLINGRKAFMETRKGARVYTVFKPQKIVVRPVVLAEGRP